MMSQTTKRVLRGSGFWRAFVAGLASPVTIFSPPQLYMDYANIGSYTHSLMNSGGDRTSGKSSQNISKHNG